MKEAFDKGLAVGVPQITNDSIYFRFKEETFEFPAFSVLGVRKIARFNGCYYEAPVKKLRALKKIEEKSDV